MRRAQLHAVALAIFGCGAADDPSVEPCHRYGEVAWDTRPLSPLKREDTPPLDLLFVVRPELRPAVEAIVHDVVMQFAWPHPDEQFGESIDHWPRVRATIVDLPELRALLAAPRCEDSVAGAHCEATKLPHLEYVARPYGYGTDERAFDGALHCLMQGGHDCASLAELSDSPFTLGGAEIVWFTDQDICAVDADGCEEFQSLQRWRSAEPGDLGLAIVAALPADLVAPLNGMGWYDTTYQTLLANPSLPAADQALRCGERSADAHVPRKLIAQLDANVPLISLCEAKPAPTIAVEISLKYEGIRSYGGWVLCSEATRRLPVASDGLVSCDFTEVLPATGPITRCAQLGDHGRDAVPIATREGAEVCRVQQLTLQDDSIARGQGFAYGRLTRAEAKQRGLRSLCALSTDDRSVFWASFDFSLIPGGDTRLVCTTQDSLSCPHTHQ